MVRRLPNLLAFLLACSTVLAGVPLIAAAALADPQAGPCLAPEPFDPEKVSESRGENAEEEREEEEQEEAGSDVDLFAGRGPESVLDGRQFRLATPDSLQVATCSHARGRSIRGPPAR